jgi:hypothetical protein
MADNSQSASEQQDGRAEVLNLYSTTCPLS